MATRRPLVLDSNSRVQQFDGGSDSLDVNGSLSVTGAATHSATVKHAKGADIASAGALTIGTDGNYFHITGTTTINSFSSLQAGTEITLEFDGSLILTYNATSLILPTSANVTTAAGDVATFISEGSGNWRCRSYQRRDGTALLGSGAGAPSTSQYVTLATDANLSAERVLTGTSNQITITDNGANGTVVLSTPQNIHTTATPTFGGLTLSGIEKLGKGANIASTGSMTVGTDGNYFHITGTTTITSLSTVQAGTFIILEFDGALTLTHHATSLILPTGASITTAAGDIAAFISEGSGNWRCAFYQRKSGASLVGGSSTFDYGKVLAVSGCYTAGFY